MFAVYYMYIVARRTQVKTELWEGDTKNCLFAGKMIGGPFTKRDTTSFRARSSKPFGTILLSQPGT